MTHGRVGEFGLMVNDASYGEGKVTHVEFQYALLHDRTVFLDKAKGIALSLEFSVRSS